MSQLNSTVVNGSLRVNGNLIISGNTTQIETTNLAIKDKLLELAKDNTSAIDYAGFYVPKYDGTNTVAFVVSANGKPYCGNVTISNYTISTNSLKQIALMSDVTSAISSSLSNYIRSGTSSLEMNSNGSLGNYGGFIDFHFHKQVTNDSGTEVNSPTDASGNIVSTSPDYTSRIIENSAGNLQVNGANFKTGGIVSAASITATKTLTASSISASTITVSTITASNIRGTADAAHGVIVTKVASGATGMYSLLAMEPNSAATVTTGSSGPVSLLYKDNCGVYVIPSIKKIVATTFSGSLDGTASKAAATALATINSGEVNVGLFSETAAATAAIPKIATTNKLTYNTGTGEVSALRVGVKTSGTGSSGAYMTYNATDECIEFCFI